MEQIFTAPEKAVGHVALEWQLSNNKRELRGWRKPPEDVETKGLRKTWEATATDSVRPDHIRSATNCIQQPQIRRKRKRREKVTKNKAATQVKRVGTA
jgi:hypothetical protein